MKAGAVEFLTKAFDEQDLLRAIQEAIERDRRTRQRHADMRDLRERYESLTPREQEIILQVVSGLLNKQIAAENNRRYGQVSSRAHHAQNACQFFGRSGQNGREPRDPLESTVGALSRRSTTKV
jgi:FixJ family two-component response regulator